MAHRAERYLPVEEAHRVAHVVVVDWTYQRSGFALEAEIKGLLCRYATIRDSYLQQAHGIGKSQRNATNGGNFIERMVNTKEEVKPLQTSWRCSQKPGKRCSWPNTRRAMIHMGTPLGLVSCSEEGRQQPVPISAHIGDIQDTNPRGGKHEGTN